MEELLASGRETLFPEYTYLHLDSLLNVINILLLTRTVKSMVRINLMNIHQLVYGEGFWGVGGGLREEKDGRTREWKDRGRKKNGEEGGLDGGKEGLLYNR